MREMKDSGIEWIGEIPKDWNLSKIGAVYDERNTKVSDVEYQPLSVTKLGIVPQLETAAKTDNGDNRKLIKKNDFVINSRSDRRGSCGISEYDGSCSLINTVLKPRNNMCNKYYSFVFRSERFADEFYRWGNGIVDDLWSTKWSNMKRIYIPQPSITEQERLADYLDKKCSQIDEVIRKQERIIEKLKEYRLSVITESVTKGLSSDVEMKDSGVGYLEKIPTHWKVIKLRELIDILPGYAFSSDNFAIDKGIPLLRGINVTPNGIRWNDVVYWDKEIDDKITPFLLRENDIVMGLDRPWINEGTRVTIIKKEDLPCLLLQRVCRIRTNNMADFRFIYLFLNSDTLRQTLSLETTGVSVPHISTKQLQEYMIPLPPVQEQRAICDTLEIMTNSLDTMIKDKDVLVQKLSEYKKSIIYEVVTGKKDI